MTPTDHPASNRPHTAGVATDGPELCGSHVIARRRRRARRALLTLPSAVAMLALSASPALASTSGYAEKPPVKTTPSTTTPKSGTGPSKEATTPKTTPAPESSVEPSKAAVTPTTTTPTATTPAKSTLPFTGLDLRWVLGAGLLLLAGGLSLRLVTRRGGVRG